MNIEGTQYNVEVISQMTFEEFSSTCIGFSDNKIKNIWKQVTGRDVESKEEAIEVEETKSKKSNKKKVVDD